MTTAHRILCATDFSKIGDDALRYAIAMAQQDSARLVIIHVRARNPKHKHEVSAAMDIELTNAGGHDWRTSLEEARVESEHLYRDGDPAEEIVKAAREMCVDQIVIGTHGRQGFHRVDIGSTAEQVVQHAPCAVTVVQNEDVPQ